LKDVRIELIIEAQTMSPYLQFNGITKLFPGVRALDQVSFAADAGTVHGLVGENGAGKSTLLKILSGEYQPNHGELLIDGKPRHFTEALRLSLRSCSMFLN
jgi:L-arabinose transport system ATP-binding protein